MSELEVTEFGTPVTLDAIPARPKQTRRRTAKPNPYRDAIEAAYDGGHALAYEAVGSDLKTLVNRLRNAAASVELSVSLTIVDSDGEVISYTSEFIKDELPRWADDVFTVYAQPTEKRTRKRRTEDDSE